MTIKSLKKLGILAPEIPDNFTSMITLRARQHDVYVRQLLNLDENEWPTAIVNNQNLLQEICSSPACSSM
jgi:hypothetical protein